RRLAKELNVDLTKVKGTGKNGNITENDIRNFTEGDGEEKQTGQKISGIRQTIATRMKASVQDSAQLTETAYADVTQLSMKRKSHLQKMSWNSWLMYAAIRAIKDHLYMNGTFENDVWLESEQIHLGVATDTEKGLYVPVIENADDKSIEELDEAVNEVVQAVHDRKISASKLSGSTFTITNLGAYGVHF